MYELEVPKEDRRIDKEKNTRIVFDDGRVIERGTRIQLDEMNQIEVSVQTFHEVENEEADTWIPLRVENPSDHGVYGIDMSWRELAERVAYGKAEIVE